MNEPQFGNKVRKVLTEGTRLDDKTLERLKKARELALKQQLAERPATGLTWARDVLASFGGFAGVSFRLILPLAVLVGGLLAINGWQQKLRVAEVELESEGQVISLPEWAGQEVSEDPRYYNSQLSREPFSTWGSPP